MKENYGGDELKEILLDCKDSLSEKTFKLLKDYFIEKEYITVLASDREEYSFLTRDDMIRLYDLFLLSHPCSFLSYFNSENDTVKDLIKDKAKASIKKCISEHAAHYLIDYLISDSYDLYEYAPEILKEMIKDSENGAIFALGIVGLVEQKRGGKKYPELADEVLEECANIHPKLIVSDYIKPDSVIDESYIDTATINMIREDPLYVIIHAIFLNKNWAKKYLDFASKELINRNPKAAYEIFSNKEDLRQYNEEYANLAKRKMEEKTAFEKYPQLKKLSSALSYIGIKDIMSSIKY